MTMNMPEPYAPSPRIHAADAQCVDWLKNRSSHYRYRLLRLTERGVDIDLARRIAKCIEDILSALALPDRDDSYLQIHAHKDVAYLNVGQRGWTYDAILEFRIWLHRYYDCRTCYAIGGERGIIVIRLGTHDSMRRPPSSSHPYSDSLSSSVRLS